MNNLFLFMGCNELQIPIVDMARESGLKIISVDRNCIQELRKSSDFIIEQDLNKCKKIIDKLKEIPFKNIVGYYGVADYAYDSILKIFKILNLKNKQLNLINKLTNKIKTNQILEIEKIKHPKSLVITKKNSDILSQVENEISFPCILKQSSSYNSLGVKKINSIQEFKKISQNLKEHESILLQEKIEGRVFNIDLIFLKDKVIHHSYTERFFFEDFKAFYSIEYKDNEKFKRYFEHAVKICNKIGINFGPITLDFIEKDKKLYLLEVSQHLHSIYLNKISGRIKNIKNWFSNLKEEKIEIEVANKAKYHCAYLNVYSNSFPHLKKKINEIRLFESFIEFKSRSLADTKNDNDFLVGIFFLKNTNLRSLKQDINKINNYLG